MEPKVWNGLVVTGIKWEKKGNNGKNFEIVEFLLEVNDRFKAIQNWYRIREIAGFLDVCSQGLNPKPI